MSIELSLFKFVDALQIPISYEDGKASGKASAKLKTLVGASIPFTIKVKKICSQDQTTVLCHILGDLYILLSHFQKTGAISAYLVDAAKLEMDGVKSPPELFLSKKMSLREIIDALNVGVVVAFYWKGNEWKPLKIPR